MTFSITEPFPTATAPRLYDFIAHEAIRFYSAGEQAGAKSQDTFEFSADSPAFGSVDEFLAWNPETTDTESQTLKAIRLFQDLLTVHRVDQSEDALIDADLARLNFAHNHAFGPGKGERYAAALQNFALAHADHQISARARADWASAVKNEGDLVRAREIAKQGAGAHPGTPGGNECFNIVQQIEASHTSISTERVWNAPWPKVQLRYKNVTEAHFRIYSYRWEDFLRDDHWRALQPGGDVFNLLRTKPVAEWTAPVARHRRLPGTRGEYRRARESTGRLLFCVRQPR